MPPINIPRVRDRRDELDLSNRDLAERVDISEGHLRNILAGSDCPSRRVMYRFSRALGLPLAEIAAGNRTAHGDPSEPAVRLAHAPRGCGTGDGAQ